jgi:hypothetical protein
MQPLRVAGALMGAVIALIGVLGGGSGGVGAATPTYTVEALPLPSGTGYSSMSSLSCPKPAHCVAVGTTSNGALVETLVDSTWTPTPLNPPGLTEPELTGVWCANVTSCIAVGEDGSNGSDPQPLIERLSKGTWSVHKARIPTGGVWGSLTAINCLTITTCVAAGAYGQTTQSSHALFETLSHGTWKPATTADPAGSTQVEIDSLQCFSTTSCDAVGRWGPNGSVSNGLLETLSGTAWTASTLQSGVFLRSLTCTSSTSCLAVGYDSNSDGVSESLAGTTWTSGTLPGLSDGGTGNGIVGVACPKTVASCVAIGGWRPPPPNQSEPLLLTETLSHGKWTPTEVSAPNGYMFPEGIACPSLGTCVGIGTSDAPDGGAEAAVEQPPSS